MHHVLMVARQWLESYGYTGLFGAVFVESFGIPAPGQSSLMGASWLARTGAMSLPLALGVAWAAAVSGDSLGYLLGRRFGRKALSRLPVREEVWMRVETAVYRYGGWVVMFARFVEGFRQINGVTAGSLGMSWPKFLFFNALGAALWCAVWGACVYFAAGSIERLWHAMAPIHACGWILVGFGFVLASAWGVIRLMRERES